MAKWSTAYRNRLPDAAFLYIEPGGHKDRLKRTVPRKLRHLPVKDIQGRINELHVRAALSRIPAMHIPGPVKTRTRNKARAMLNRLVDEHMVLHDRRR